MTTRTQVEKGLEEIGACWAVRSDKYISPDDGLGEKPTYHVHPDRTYPHVGNIKRFETLQEVYSWVSACKRAYQSKDEFATVVYTGDGTWDVA